MPGVHDHTADIHECSGVVLKWSHMHNKHLIYPGQGDCSQYHHHLHIHNQLLWLCMCIMAALCDLCY